MCKNQKKMHCLITFTSTQGPLHALPEHEPAEAQLFCSRHPPIGHSQGPHVLHTNGPHSPQEPHGVSIGLVALHCILNHPHSLMADEIQFLFLFFNFIFISVFWCLIFIYVFLLIYFYVNFSLLSFFVFFNFRSMNRCSMESTLVACHRLVSLAQSSVI